MRLNIQNINMEKCTHLLNLLNLFIGLFNLCEEVEKKLQEVEN